MKLTVAGKMTMITSALLAVVFLAFALVVLGVQERTTRKNLQVNGAQVAETAATALREGMLNNDPEQIQKTLDQLGNQWMIQKIRIYSPEGRIAYSTSHQEADKVLDPGQERCLVCHKELIPPDWLPIENRTRVYRENGNRYLGVTHALLNDQSCSNAECHQHEEEEKFLGVLEVDLQLEPLEKARRVSALWLLLASIVGIVLAVVVTYLTGRQIVYRRVQSLIAGTGKLAGGDLTIRVADQSRDEIGELDTHFNQLAMDLQQARDELLEWGNTLEQRVQEKTRELTQAQDQMVQVEKMASLGKLAAVVAHEINNPLASVVTYAKTIVRRLHKKELTDECRDNLVSLDAIVQEATRCGEIVSQLLSFARRDSGSFQPTDINETVKRALLLTNHQLELAEIEHVQELADPLPLVQADQNQIQQALMALIINATQAVEEGGNKLFLRTREVDGGVEIDIQDTGPGMDEEVARHAFEPFYTTKNDGTGVGLGLSVVYGIVKRHGGRIDLDTNPGQGCRFTIFLPRDYDPPQEEENP